MTDTIENTYTMRELAIASADEVAVASTEIIEAVKDWDLDTALNRLANLLEDVDAFGAAIAQLYTAQKLSGDSFADQVQAGPEAMMPASLAPQVEAALVKHGIGERVQQ